MPVNAGVVQRGSGSHTDSDTLQTIVVGGTTVARLTTVGATWPPGPGTGLSDATAANAGTP